MRWKGVFMRKNKNPTTTIFTVIFCLDDVKWNFSNCKIFKNQKKITNKQQLDNTPSCSKPF
jgi:hypothetical protein